MYRKFDGKRFQLAYSRDTASGAQKDAQSARRDGFLARIVTRKLGRHFFFDVYVRDKK